MCGTDDCGSPVRYGKDNGGVCHNHYSHNGAHSACRDTGWNGPGPEWHLVGPDYFKHCIRNYFLWVLSSYYEEDEGIGTAADMLWLDSLAVPDESLINKIPDYKIGKNDTKSCRKYKEYQRINHLHNVGFCERIEPSMM